MATTNYRLKKGYIAQFDIPYKGIKAFSNDQMTDDLAKEFLRQHPSRAIYFEKNPPLIKVTPAEKIEKVKVEIKAESQPGSLLGDTMKDLQGENKTEVIPPEEKPNPETKVKTLSQMNKGELVMEALKYKEIENPDVYNNFDLANLIRKATGVKELSKTKK